MLSGSVLFFFILPWSIHLFILPKRLFLLSENSENPFQFTLDFLQTHIPKLLNSRLHMYINKFQTLHEMRQSLNQLLLPLSKLSLVQIVSIRHFLAFPHHLLLLTFHRHSCHFRRISLLSRPITIWLAHRKSLSSLNQLKSIFLT